MARRSSSNGNDGCALLTLILFFIIAGNIALFTGNLSDTTSIIIIVIADIIILGFIIANRSKSSSSEKSSTSASSRPGSTSVTHNTYDAPVSRNPSFATRSTQPVRTTPLTTVNTYQEDRSRLGRLKERYRTPDLPTIPVISDPLQKSMESYHCLPVLQVVNRVVNKKRGEITNLRRIQQDISNALLCIGCTSDRERIKHINEQKEVLENKRVEYLKAFNAYSSTKVRLLSKNDRAFGQLRTVFSEVSLSKSISGNDKVPFHNFAVLNSSIPGDLFDTVQSPIELNFGWYHYYLLPEVILVFKSDKFVTALEPFSLIIAVQDRRRDVYTSRSGYRGWSYSDDIIDSDSTFISQGEVRTSWLHEKKNGGPDLRYSDNPMFESRYDTYSYTEISIQIGSNKAVYSASKGQFAAKLRPLYKDYCSLSHKLNVLPSLLRLLEATAREKEEATALFKAFENTCNDMICKEVNI